MSDIARIKSQIAAQYEATQRALSGPAYAGRHAFINARVENMGRAMEALMDMVSFDKANQIFKEALDEVDQAAT